MNWKLALLAFMLLGSVLGCASEYQFGTKVMTSDSDMGKPLIPAGVGTGVYYLDIGPVGLDEGDPVYLHLGVNALSPGFVATNDIRLTPFGDLLAGSKVTATDIDLGKPLKPLIFAAIKFMNDFGGPGYDLEDPVYLDSFGLASPLSVLNDVRLTSVDGLLAGTHVRNSDPDISKAYGAALIPALPFFWTFLIRWDDVNSNGYDYADDVYMTQTLTTTVKVNNLRLSGPT